MSRALTKALQLHPTAPSLWTYAAAWEFEHNLNASAARALMQRGLRMCKDTPALWHEYFRMELLYAMRLRERRRVLGIEDAGVHLSSGGACDVRGTAMCCKHMHWLLPMPNLLQSSRAVWGGAACQSALHLHTDAICSSVPTLPVRWLQCLAEVTRRRQMGRSGTSLLQQYRRY